jgi:hypothetical protein
MDEVGKYVRNLVVTPCDLQQLKDADVGPEQIQIEMNCRSRSKCIGEIFLGYMPA